MVGGGEGVIEMPSEVSRKDWGGGGAAARTIFIWGGRGRSWTSQDSRIQSDHARAPAGIQWAWGMSGEQSEWVWGGRGGSCRRGPVGTSLTLLEANYELLRSFQIANHT